LFRYDAPVIERFATIRACVGNAVDVANVKAPVGLGDEYRSEQATTLERIGDTPLSEIPSIAAWRRVFTGFGVKPTQYRNAAESLLRRLTKKGDIPSISPLVDIGNMVSIRYALPVAFFDLDGIEGTTTVAFADGDEDFTDLGSDAPVRPDPGEVVFIDETDVVSARRWCWRQSAQSATSKSTSRVLITVEGHHEEAQHDVAAAFNDIAGCLERYDLGEVVSFAELSPENPELVSGP
jgi:DNA/RNA-binding domain of Phe-tRNA-synthetase-like protein